MSSRSVDLPDGVPSPELVASWLILGTLPTEKVPLWAANWIVAGYDRAGLSELAGLSGADSHDVRDLLGPVLVECGVTPSDLPGRQIAISAAAMRAFDSLARLLLDGRAGERWVLEKASEIVELDGFGVTATMPLGRIAPVLDEWIDGWGRGEDELSAIVRQACADQLARRALP